MTDDRDLVPALGGTRLIPAPDPIASDYLLLGLRLDQHIPGLVDSYYGPADLKARADLEQRRSPARLLDDIAALSERVEREVEAPDRRTWFLAQLGALDAHTRALAGQPLSYIDHVERCLGYPPRRHADHEFDDAPLHGHKAPLQARVLGRFAPADLVVYHRAMLTADARAARRARYERLDPEAAHQAIGYAYLTDESGLRVAPLPPGRGWRE